MLNTCCTCETEEADAMLAEPISGQDKYDNVTHDHLDSDKNSLHFKNRAALD